MAFKMKGINFGEGTGSAFTKNGDGDKKVKSTISNREAKGINVENISAVQEKDGQKFVVEIGDNEYYDPNEKDGIGGKTKFWEGNYNDTNNRRDTILVNNNYKVGDLIDETEWEKGKATKKSPMKQKTDFFKGKTTKAKKDKEYAEMIERSKKTWSKQRLIDYERYQRWKKNNPSERKIAKGKSAGKLSKTPLTGERVTSKRSYYNPITKKVHRSNWFGWKTDH